MRYLTIVNVFSDDFGFYACPLTHSFNQISKWSPAMFNVSIIESKVLANIPGVLAGFESDK